MINVVPVASGSGTDFNAVATAYRQGLLNPKVFIPGMISTKENVDCVKKAAALDIPSVVIPRAGRSLQEFQQEFAKQVQEVWEAHIVFLLGCIHPVPEIAGVEIWNVHPANTRRHGGKGLYGLEPHKSVLREIVQDVKRGMAKETDTFYTEIVIHEVTPEYDHGRALLTVQVEIPWRVVNRALCFPEALDDPAKELQQIVLRHEHLILPTALNHLILRSEDIT